MSLIKSIPFSLALPPSLQLLFEQCPPLRNAYLVGGCVRDALRGVPQKDYDIEVYEVTYPSLVEALSAFGTADLVGRSFGVIKLTMAPGVTYDFSLPRRDSKVSAGHRGFEIEAVPGLDLLEASSRRDFTINALLYHPIQSRLYDPFGGLDDLGKKILRHIGPAFSEDPLRVLRAMQMVSRFEFSVAPETLALCRSMKSQYPELARERVREEWFKWATQGLKPSLGLQFLEDCEWLEHYPELHCLRDIPQDPEWHPEGNVWKHTLHCCDALVRLPHWQNLSVFNRTVLAFAVLCHDLGKSLTTEAIVRNGKTRIISPKHDQEGLPLVRSFLDRLQAPNALYDHVIPLVSNHMTSLSAISSRAINRLSKRLSPSNIELLTWVMKADASGRPPKPPQVLGKIDQLLESARALHIENQAPPPILQGRHLIHLGIPPGPAMGIVLKKAYEAQLDGEFTDQAAGTHWLKQHLAES